MACVASLNMKFAHSGAFVCFGYLFRRLVVIMDNDDSSFDKHEEMVLLSDSKKQQTPMAKKKSTQQEQKLGGPMKSLVYQEYLAERDEIMRHKWLESEKAGCDIGFERALLDWIVKHRCEWRKCRR